MASSKDLEWACLPEDILYLILDKLVSLSDYLQFSAVCKPWRCVTREYKKQRSIINASRPQLPMLMIPTKDNSEERRSLYSITKNKIYDFQVKVPYNKRYCGSSHGWLIITEKDMCMLLNPFSGATICLPPMTKEYPETIEDVESYQYDYHFKKAILTSDPSLYPNDYIVAAIYFGMSGMCKLAVFKSGDKEWTNIPHHEGINLFGDVIYYTGKVHAVDHWMGLGEIDFISNNGDKEASCSPQLNVVAPRPACRCHPMFRYRSHVYIVETTRGDLLLVRRFLKEKDHETQFLTWNFKVFKLVHPSRQGLREWVEIESLGDDALFLGNNYSISVSSLDFPGCQSNCIYYTDDETDGRYEPFGPRDAGIFNLEDGSFKLHYVPDPLQKHMPQPIWIVPTLHSDRS